MICAEIEELLGAYALDAVTPEEKTAIEAHIAQCSNCIQQLKELRSAVDLLPLSVSQVAPPPELKERILSAVQTLATTSSQSTHRLGAVQPVQLQAQPPLRQAAQAPDPVRRRRTGVQRWAMPLVAAAALLLLVLSGVLTTWNISLQRQITTLRENSITTTTYAIKGTADAPDATGQITYISKLNITVMELHGLPGSGSKVYQGWLIQGKQTRSLGLLNLQGNGDATINFPGNVQGYDAAAVSLEKGPTATPNAPKGKVIALGPLKKHT